LHPLAVEDAMARHQRPKVDQYSNFYLVIFYSVAIEAPDDGGQQPAPRGLRGTDFYHRGGDPHPPEPNGTGIAGGIRGIKTSPWGAGKLPPPGKVDPNGAAPEISGPETSNPSAAGLGNERIVLREISMFMGENYLITVHNSPIP